MTVSAERRSYLLLRAADDLENEGEVQWDNMTSDEADQLTKDLAISARIIAGRMFPE